MKPKNFPARKLTRKMKAKGIEPTKEVLELARQTRTKKRGKGILGGGRKEVK